MRDMFRFIYLVPIVIVLGIFFISIGGSDIDLESSDGSITVTHQGEDYDISVGMNSSGITFKHSPTQALDARVVDIIPGTGPYAGIHIDLEHQHDANNNSIAQYEIGIDSAALTASLGQPNIDICCEPDGSDPDTSPDLVPDVQQLTIYAPSSRILDVGVGGASDNVTLSFGLNSGTTNQALLTNAGGTGVEWENIDLSVTARTGTQLQVASSAAGTNATIPSASTTEAGLMSGADKIKIDGLGGAAPRSVHYITSTTYSSANQRIEGSLALDDSGDVALGHVLIFVTPASLPDSTSYASIRIDGETSNREIIGYMANLIPLNTLVPNRVYWGAITAGTNIRLFSPEGEIASTPMEAEVTVSAADIKTLDTTLVELIAAPGVGKHLVIEQAWLVKSGTEAAILTPACPGTSPRTPTAGCIKNASISVMFVSNQVTPNQPFHIYTDSIGRVFLSGFYNADNILSGEEYSYGEKIGGHALYENTALQLGVWYNFPLSDNYSEAAWDAFTASLTAATSLKFQITYRVEDMPDLN